PTDVAAELIDRVEPAPLDEALGQAEGHRGVVGPLAGLEAERAAAADVVDRGEGPRGAKFQGRAERVAGGKPEERTPQATDPGHRCKPGEFGERARSTTTGGEGPVRSAPSASANSGECPQVAVGAREQAGGLGVARDRLALGIEADRPADALSDVAQVA